MKTHFSLADFDFDLPPQLIAQHPAAQRSGSRLLDGRAPLAVDSQFTQLPELLLPGDLLVFNDTKVVKARLYGQKSSGGRLELLIERVLSPHGQDNEVAVHMKVSKKPKPGAVMLMDGGFSATLIGRWPNPEGPLYHFKLSQDPYEVMESHGHVPLPPYITHSDSADDEQRYQTVFARAPGAVAAPTAALHFDADMLTKLAARGVQTASVTLHVGAGTFQPVKAENIAEHVMHFERFEVPSATLEAIAACKARGGRVVAVGTTTVRALESRAKFGPDCNDTNIFITPGYSFAVVDMLLTNFHLPKSTLMMLVSAFAGHAHIMALYHHAIAQSYRFFSYGDAMLLARTAPAP
ncbi:S-adenosylmethionine:tRNA ribosyltransferase-isomerase [Polaromonas vacuolata]|uniref:S-adenosylmethionine:tRNA ribosyltransferase-isomerase n=1 Tax=Polaromonas vacuolata TaxID=37448 RepID=A0A6H2HDN9_9BURK|nr:tRNA preQ1(34) S-adenosylmethionine ribosyltransferase-isomerase QueA [Polaromonas vacuolata]QJC57877.1 S-adenosylmethionine:tRNA ribosyltransferase-isomerase [Polaromonas vacuolata]